MWTSRVPTFIRHASRRPWTTRTVVISIETNGSSYIDHPRGPLYCNCRRPSRNLNDRKISGTYHGSRSSESSRMILTRQFSSQSIGYSIDPSKIPSDCQMELDFFGEAVTFAGLSSKDEPTKNARAALDGFLLCVVSRGLSCVGGGDEAGLEPKSAHAAALSWAECLRHAAVWNSTGQAKSAPMLAVVAVAPLVAQAGIGYLRHLDSLLKQAKPGLPGLPTIQLYEIAKAAIERKNDAEKFNKRERLHLLALECLMRGDHPTALTTYLRILRSCPGDTLALSLAMDVALVLGDRQSALRAAGSVAAYWNERRGGFIRPALPGHSMASSLIALGYAVGGRSEEAEMLADYSMKEGKRLCGALATWAQVHVFDARGRIAEGISACANFDGIANYEGAGFLFFDCRLAGYGCRFSLDREERGRGKSAALRLYEYNFERVLGYSGFDKYLPWRKPMQQAPIGWIAPTAIDGGDETEPSFFDRMMGKGKKEEKDKEEFEIILKRINFPSTNLDNWEPSIEDVLTWIPPTPGLLLDSTLLCLRLTLNGTMSHRDSRWDNIRNAWLSLFDIQKKQVGSVDLRFYPLACTVASLLFPPSETGADSIGSARVAEGLYLMGELLKLGNPVTEEQKERSIREVIAERDPYFWLPSKKVQSEWVKVVHHLASGIDGLTHFKDSDDVDDNVDLGSVDPSSRVQAWDFEARPILEHAIVYAACKSGDVECLCLARAICSQGVMLRTNSPEEWWRYSIVLGLLGDEVGSEDALNFSINFGGGQGSSM